MRKRFAARPFLQPGAARAFALMAAMGVAAVLILMVAGIGLMVQQNQATARRLRQQHSQLALAEAAAALAIRSAQPASALAQGIELTLDGAPCRVTLKPTQSNEILSNQPLYKAGGLAFRPGDTLAEVLVGTPRDGVRAVWLANAQPGAERMTLLERGARVGQ